MHLAPSSPRHRFLVSCAPRSDRQWGGGGGLEGRIHDVEHPYTTREERPTPLSHRRLTALHAVHPTPPPEPTHRLYRMQHRDGHQRRRCPRCVGDVLPPRRIVVLTRKRTRRTVYVAFDGTDLSQKLMRST
jgi:hypothetical protein